MAHQLSALFHSEKPNSKYQATWLLPTGHVLSEAQIGILQEIRRELFMTQSFAAPYVAVGQVIADKYLVERVIGEGGMGVVVAARHVELDERFAIKFLLPEALANAEAVARFAREARASVRIKSEHVARTMDVGRLENGAPYMVMEYLEGTDLATRILQCGPLPIEQAVVFVLETCEALADAHAMGIIHRDLKPSNLFVIRRTDGTESIKLLDFGISKITKTAIDGPAIDMTRTAAFMGSPVYMSPEQLTSSRDVDCRTDIWSLGVTLFELLTGKPPFVAESIAELGAKVLTYPTPSVRERRPDVPEALDFVIQLCLAKSARDRWLNVAELAYALADFGPRRLRYSAERISRVLGAAGLSASALQLPPSADTTPALNAPEQTDSAVLNAAERPDATAASWGATKPPIVGRRGLVVSGLVVLGVSLLALLIFAGKFRRHQDAVHTSAAAAQAPASAQLTTVPGFSDAQSAASSASDTTPATPTPIDINSLPLVEPSALPVAGNAHLAGSVPRKPSKSHTSDDKPQAAPSSLPAPLVSAVPQPSAKAEALLPEFGGRKR
jgi:eukaryotic-like serine/threonine-protein kinase